MTRPSVRDMLVTVSMSNKTEQMRTIKDEVVGLSASPLYAYRTENNFLPVIGEGSHDAEIVLIGEAPGKNEAQTGRPFCGRSGTILDELLEHIKLDRDDVYITNIVKDRPPQNRDPLPEEIEVYGPFLDRQIEIIEPKVIATLGRYSMIYVLKKFGLDATKPISKAHGTMYNASTSSGDMQIIPLYHPAAAIYTRSLIDTLKKDFEVLKKYVEHGA